MRRALGVFQMCEARSAMKSPFLDIAAAGVSYTGRALSAFKRTTPRSITKCVRIVVMN